MPPFHSNEVISSSKESNPEGLSMEALRKREPARVGQLYYGRRIKRSATLAMMVLSVVGCTPVVYQNEVASFASSVDGASKAFEGLRADTLAERKKKIEAEVAEAPAADVSDECSAIIVDMHTTVQCWAQWARYRTDLAAGQHPTPPSGKCAPEPSGFAGVPPEKVDECRFGSTNAAGNFVPPRTSPTLPYPKISSINVQLADYAMGLAQIVDAKDQTELMTAAGDAKSAILKVRDDVAAQKAAKNPSKQASEAKVDTIGPIVDLVSSGLTTLLAQRRFNALSKIVHASDNVVRDAAEELSKAAFSMQLEANIEPAEKELVNTAAVTRAKDVGTGAFPAKVHEVAEAHAKYVALLEADFSAAFKAVADTHHALVAALDDPSTQFDSLKRNVQELADKVNALQSALNARRLQKKNEKNEPKPIS
jgi:hypothetical protein